MATPRSAGLVRRVCGSAGWLLAALLLPARPAAAADTSGVVTVGGVAVPGATITATNGGSRVSTVSGIDGSFRLADLAAGTWTVRVEMAGFAPLVRDVRIPPEGPVDPWELALLPFEELAKTLAASPGFSASGTAPGPGAGAQARGFQRADVTPTPPPPSAGNVGSVFAAGDPDDNGMGAADGLLINGSVNNGASSPFALARAFGNNRPGQRSLYNGGLALLSNTSAWDARPFSFTGQPSPRPDYSDMQVNATFGGPLRIPRLLDRRGPNTFVGYQRSRHNGTTTQPGLVPTPAERGGDFSSSVDRLGRPVQVTDPLTGQPFPGNVIPRDRISPQAASLLGYYPAPNIARTGGYNYQSPLLARQQQDSAQARVSQVVNTRDQLVGTVNYTRTTTGAASLFGFVDTTRVSSLDTGVTLSHRLSQFLFLRARYQLTRQANDVTPHFANRLDVSGLAGIAGNDRAPENWGPPALTFAGGIDSLSSAQYARNTDTTHGGSAELFMAHGRHSFTFGGGARTQHLNVFSQQNARGAFTFTGGATGSDLADFLLGLPQAGSIAFGNPDKLLRATALEGYVNDDWRASATLTLNLGLRWEYESPITEARDRLVNLDIAPGFTAASPVLAGEDRAALTNRAFGRGLVSPDRSGLQPRIGLAWRPVPGSSLVVRGGYGLYRNTQIYQSVALALAQQPPFSTTANLETSVQRPLTLATGFVSAAGATLNTFAVDPRFRAGLAENWQASVQRDLPISLTITGTYLGTRGHRLMQQVLPNTTPPGTASPCPSCPAGFIYLTSTGRSAKHAGVVQVRRRLRNGFTASVQYTLSKAMDDAAAFNGAGLTGAAVAQNWQDLDAEWARSSFDQRHGLVLQAQYTSGAGLTGGTLVDGWRGRLLKDWTLATQITTGSGLPVTPLWVTPVRGVTGTMRASLTGASPDAVPAGYYLNPGAYGAPAPGTWGTAGRNSISGPAQFSMNAAVGRTFRWGARLNLDWRFDATNVLNTLTYASVNTVVGSPQFGLPNRTNQPRKLQSSLRLRF